MYSIVRGRRVVPRPRTSLYLGVRGVCRVLDCEDEDQVVKSSSPPRDGICDLILIIAIKYASYSLYS